MGNRGISGEGMRMRDHAAGKLHLRKCGVEKNYTYSKCGIFHSCYLLGQVF